MRDVNIVETIRSTLQEFNVSPDLLELEITESMMVDYAGGVEERINALRKIGVTISVDDFGTGYSSLSQLKRLPLNTLKIDKSFIKELTQGSDDFALVSAIMSIAERLNLHTIAEGVETEEQLEVLKSIGCHEIQGFLFSRPLPAEEFARYMKAGILN